MTALIAAVSVDLDLTALNPLDADRILNSLPEPDRTRTTYVYCGQESYAVVATTYHPDGPGHERRVKSIGSLDEVDDRLDVEGLSVDEWENYLADRRSHL